jgi:hypothetical protein
LAANTAQALRTASALRTRCSLLRAAVDQDIAVLVAQLALLLRGACSTVT